MQAEVAMSPRRSGILGFLFVVLIVGPLLADPAAPAPSEDTAATQPDAPPWFSKPHDTWPPMVLRDRIDMPKHEPWQIGCGFLLKLPTGRVVPVAGSDAIVKYVNLHDLKNSVSPWTMCPPAFPDPGRHLNDLATPPDP